MINRKIKGNRFEQESAQRLRVVFPYCHTARMQGNLFIDSCGVDLVNTDPFYFQCKAQEKLTVGLHDVLKDMPETDNINVVLWRKNQKGVLACIDFDDFLTLIADIQLHNKRHKKHITNNIK